MVSEPPEQRGDGRGRFGRRREELPRSEPGREPPHSVEAEEHVLACCLLDGDQVDAQGNLLYPTLARARRAGITEDAFYFPAAKELWRQMVGLYTAARPVTLETLAEQLKTDRKLSAVGGFAYLMQVTSKIPTTTHAGYFIETLIEKQSLREYIRAATAVVEGAYSYSGGGLDGYAPVVENLARLEQLKSKGRGELPPVLGWSEFVPKEQSRLPDELVKGVLHRGGKMMISGGSKSFKTWVLLHLGLSIAAGKPWWGMETVRGDVLYVNMELMREFCEVRVRQIGAAMKVGEVPGFHSWHLRGFARDFKDLLPHFIARMARGQYSLIILDPVYKILGERDENANGEVAQLLNEFEALAVRTGAAVAYGHHHSKGNQSEKDARDRSSGAGAWTRDPDALIDLTPHEEDEHFTATFTLRNHAPKTPMVIRWEFPVMSIAPGMDPTALRKPGRAKEYTVGQIVTLLMGREPGLTYGEWEAAAVKAGISESTFKRLLKQAVDDKKVQKAMGLYSLPKPQEN